MKIRPRQIASTSAFAFVLALSGSAFAQQVQCTPPASLCNNMAGRPLYGEAAGGATCPPGTQIPISVCDERLPRLGFQQAGTSDIRPGQQWTVRALPGPTVQRTTVYRLPSSYGALQQQVTLDGQNIAALDHNQQVYAARQALVNAGQGQLNQVLIANDQELARRNAATNARVDGFDFRLRDLGSEMRYRIFTTSRVSAQVGGTRVITTPGIGFGFVKWGERSNWGIDFQASVSGYADQALVPGAAPLMNLSSSIGAAVGRVWPVQVTFGLSLSLTGRFGDAGQGEATGPTQGSACVFVGIRGEHPFFPRAERPNGAAFFWQVRGGGGAGFVQTILQRPLIGGATGELDLALGVTL